MMTATPPEATEPESAAKNALPAQAEQVVRLANEDLAQKLNLMPDAIELVSVEAVEWPDTSLGCPQPGMMYAQVITPGFRVTLEAEGEEYVYHTDREDHVVLCQPQEGGQETKPPTEAEGVIQLAREDLAQKLGLAPEAIRLVSVEAVEWSDASLGCPQPGMMYAQVITPGYLVVLEAGGKTYNYHTDIQQIVVYCESPGVRSLLGDEPTEMIQLAKEDLARKLGISLDSIEVLAVIGQEFSADAFYCRTTKARIAREESTAMISGETILLSASGRKYEYHADGQTVIFCRPLP